jgi:hypothetical protein
MPRPPPGRRRPGHVAAWIRLKLPAQAEPTLLLGGSPPPPSPPLALLEPEPVSTDPRKRIYAWEGPWSEGTLRLKWDADYADVLEAEYRVHERRPLRPEEVRAFWAEVKGKVAELGPLPVDDADPRP